MKKIVSSLLILISIFLFQQTLIADNINEAVLIANSQTAQTDKQKRKAIKKLLYYYINTKDYEKIVPISQDLLNFKLSKKEKYTIYFNLAKAYQNLQTLEEAVNYALEAEYLYPKKMEVKLLLGNLYKDNRLYELATAKFSECLDLSSRNIEALINLGEIYNIQENYKASLKYYEQAKELADNNKYINLTIDNYINMAKSAKEIGFIEQAQSILESIEDKNKDVSLLLANIYHSKHEFDKAIRKLTPFIYREDTDIEIYCKLAQLYLLSKRYTDAEDLLLYFKGRNTNNTFEVIDLLLVEALYKMYGDKQKALNKLHEISNYTHSDYIKNVIEKSITFEKNQRVCP